jgi:hypothetical protein
MLNKHFGLGEYKEEAEAKKVKWFKDQLPLNVFLWNTTYEGGLLTDKLLQRITTVRSFLENDTETADKIKNILFIIGDAK